MSDGPFSRQATVFLGALLAVSLLAGVYLIIWGESVPETDSAGGRRVLVSSGSPSAIGFLAFRNLLTELGVPVTPCRLNSGENAGDAALLVIAAPGADPVDPRAEDLAEMLDSAERVLLILPKYRRESSRLKPEWSVSPVPMLETSQVEDVLSRAGALGRVARTPKMDLYPSSLPSPTVDNLQLIDSRKLDSIVRGPRGILFGRIKGRDNSVYILSDPDILSNMGLHRGENGPFAAELVEYAGDGFRAVIIDETLHGLYAPGHIWGQLLEFPLVIGLAHLILLLGFLLWAGTGRFGAPLSEEEGLPTGKAVLIGNTADLLLHGGHSPDTLDRYLRLAMAEASGKRAMAQGRTGLLERLAAHGKDRGVTIDIKAIAEEVGALRRTMRFDEGRVLTLARDIYQWKKEFLHGTG